MRDEVLLLCEVGDSHEVAGRNLVVINTYSGNRGRSYLRCIVEMQCTVSEALTEHIRQKARVALCRTLHHYEYLPRRSIGCINVSSSGLILTMTWT